MALWTCTVLLLFIYCCECEELINESSENYNPHIWGILNYFNTDPNRIYNYNVGVLENAQKTERGLFLQIEAEVECRLNPTDPRCGPKIHICQAYIEKIEGIDRYEILPGASCHPKYESSERINFNGESPVQSSSVLQVNEDPTSSVQVSSEGGQEGDTDDQFVAVRRDSSHCLGCVFNLDKNVEGLPNLITTALKHLESERDKKHVLLNVLKVQRQVVAGVKYILLLEIASTTCSKDIVTVTPESCPLDSSSAPQICQVIYLQQPWLGLQKHIIANNCTTSQEFTDVSNPKFLNPKRRFPNDLDNEIIANDFNNQHPTKGIKKEPDQVPNFDEIANSGRFDVDNSGGGISPSALAEIESQVEFRRIPTTETATTSSVPDVDRISSSSSPETSSTTSSSTPEELDGEPVVLANHERKKRSSGSKTSFKKSSPYNKQWLKMLARYVVEEKLGTDKEYDVIEVLFPKEQKSSKHGGVIYSFLINIKKTGSEQLESCKTKVLIPKDKSAKEILKFKCYNDMKGNKKLSRVPRKAVRPGGTAEVSVSDPKINELVHSSLLHLNLNSNSNQPSNKYKVVEIIAAHKQVVAGLLYRITAKIILTECNQNDLLDSQQCLELQDEKPRVCDITIWDRPWLNNGRETNITCEGDETQYTFKTNSDLLRPSKHKRSVNTRRKHHKRSEEKDNSSIVGHFERFMITHNKNYSTLKEYKYRLKVFQENMEYVHLLNKYEQGTGKYGITKFADLTTEEFRKYTGLRPDLKDHNAVGNGWAEIPEDIELPIEFDWRSKNAVTEVKNQGSCGSCWAFSVTGNVEGQYAIKHGQLLEFSEQELVDCDTVDSGCDGGLMDNAYRAIEKLGGLESESDYPYEAEGETCNFRSNLVEVKLTGAVNISTNETDMAKWLVKNGPISIAINANAMQFYFGGVSHPWKLLCNPNNLDHGVLIVGYGVHKYPYLKKTLPYWIVKNSWGKSWGQQGYYLVYRGDGTCGLNQTPSSAIVE